MAVILTNVEDIAKAINKAVFPGVQGGPQMHLIAAKAVSFREALEPSFKEYAQQVVDNAKILGETLVNEGAALVSGGTDNHLVLLDLRPWNLTGKEAEQLLEEAGITTNKNTIPYDPEKPSVASGIRMGTAALTTRGMKQKEMVEIGQIIASVLKNKDNKEVLQQAKEKTRQISAAFPLHQRYVTV